MAESCNARSRGYSNLGYETLNPFKGEGGEAKYGASTTRTSLRGSVCLARTPN